MKPKKIFLYFCRFLLVVLGIFLFFCACIIAHDIGVEIAIAQHKAKVEIEKKNDSLDTTSGINFFGRTTATTNNKENK